MVEITSLSDVEIDDEPIGTLVLTKQVALRENKTQKAKTSLSKRLNTECCGSEVSSYAEYDTSHYQKPIFKRKRIFRITIGGLVLGMIALGAGLGVYFTRGEQGNAPDVPDAEDKSANITFPTTTTSTPTATTMPLATTSNNPFSWQDVILPSVGIFTLAISAILRFPIITTTTSTTTTTTTTTPASTWGEWGACTPAHNCLDTVSSAQSCPVRTRSGRVWKDGQFIDVQQESSETCNCEPCTFRLTDWTGGDCTRDPGVASGGGDCPCHWTLYRYCQQLSNGKKWT